MVLPRIGAGLPGITYQKVTKQMSRVRELTAPDPDTATPDERRIAARRIPSGGRESVWTARDGHALRLLDLGPVPDRQRGTLLMMPGRADTYEKWLETLDHWHRAGWRCFAADWRGQARSGRFGDDPMTGHVEDFVPWLDDLTDLCADLKAEHPGPFVLVGHSMGGHLCLRAVAEGRLAPDALVLTAPMLGLLPSWVPSLALRAAAALITHLGDPRRPAWKRQDSPDLLQHARMLLLTHDVERFADEDWWYAERPDLRVGAPSWRWIEQALVSIRVLERPGMLEAVRVPVLIMATRKDGLVSWPAIRRAAARLPNCRLIVFGEEARHEILRESDPVRNRALDAMADFLDREVPSRA